LRWFLAYWLFVAAVAFTWAGEKMPWVALHILMPLCWVAGMGLVRLWESVFQDGRRRRGLIFAPFFLVAALLWIRAELQWNFPVSGAAVELGAYAEADPGFPSLLRYLEGLAPSSRIRLTGEVAWPVSWYLRDVPDVGEADGIRKALAEDPDLFLFEPTQGCESEPALAGFELHDFPCLSWPDEGYKSDRTSSPTIEGVLTRFRSVMLSRRWNGGRDDPPNPSRMMRVARRLESNSDGSPHAGRDEADSR